jgi:hypothetical protein
MVTMLALAAAACFLLALFDVHLGSINLVDLGLLFVALHLAFAPAITARWGRRT